MKLFGKGGLIDFSVPMSTDEVEAKLNRYYELYDETFDESKVPQTEEECDLFYELSDKVAGFPGGDEDEEEDHPKRKGWFW